MDATSVALRVVGSLAAVLLLVFVMSKVARRRGARTTIDLARFAVVGRQSLSRAASVAIVRLGEDALVVGVTDHGVTLLQRTTLESLAPEADPGRVRSTVLPNSAVQPSNAAPTAATPAASSRRVVLPTTSPAASVPAPRTSSPLSGSALSPATWTTALEALRERTTRR